jgi:anti-sigma-K factor RskA
MTAVRHDLASSSGAYVLHSLEPAEVEQFERVLAGSPELRDEVTELSDTAVELGLALRPIRPDADLRARILAEIAVTPQRNGLVAVDPLPESAPSRIRRRTARRRWLPRATALVAGVAAAVGLVFAIAQVTTPVPPTSDGPVAVGSAADAQIAHIPVDGGGMLTVEWSHRLRRSVVTGDGLPSLAGDRTYQLWYIDGKIAHPAGVFDGRSGIELSGRMAEGDTIGMTVEPKGGASAPSMVPIASVAT